MIVMIDLMNVFVMDDIKFMMGYDVELVVVLEMSLCIGIDKYYGLIYVIEFKKVMDEFDDMLIIDDLEVFEEEEDVDFVIFEEELEDVFVVCFVNIIFMDVIKCNVLDIYVELYEKEYCVCYCIDGIFYEMMNLLFKLCEVIMSCIKIMVKFDIVEKCFFQDGCIKIKMKFGGKMKDFDYCVFVLLMFFGEKIVMWLFDKDNFMFDFMKFGFEDELLCKFEYVIVQFFGMVLVIGLMGFGKMNMFYLVLFQVNSFDMNIMIVEDLVEFNLFGINQVQMKELIGFNFVLVLCLFFCQDLNIVFVGEI